MKHSADHVLADSMMAQDGVPLALTKQVKTKQAFPHGETEQDDMRRP